MHIVPRRRIVSFFVSATFVAEVRIKSRGFTQETMMPAVKSIVLILSLILIAVAVGLLIHPAMSLVFIALAKVVEILWSHGAPAFRESYRQTMNEEKPKRKLKHILTDDGETLDVVFADGDIDEMAGTHHD